MPSATPPTSSPSPVTSASEASATSSATASPISPVSKPTLPTLKTPCSAGQFPSEMLKTSMSGLKTPCSAGPYPFDMPRSARPLLPSELPRSAGPLLSAYPRSPLPGWAHLIKEEENIKTPLTPPTAYTDFLKALSPAISTPATSNSSSFSDKSGKLTPMSQPSSTSSSFPTCGLDSKTSAPSMPNTPFVRPHLSRTPSCRTPTTLQRLRIPGSPVYSPTTASPKSSAMRSPFSPADWVLDGKTRHFASPRSSGGHRPVSVRQVVTRTVTYTQTPLEPAPRGKRRKLE
ncbi:hypothetical protein MMC25_000110 [Agyrium rufum]|nr:hypothetical protein [Agyrium rufum]